VNWDSNTRTGAVTAVTKHRGGGRGREGRMRLKTEK